MVIKLTKQQIDRSKPPSDGWHLFKIESFTSEDTKNKDSKNWTFEMVIVEESDDNGRYGFARFNSKAPGFLVTSGFLPAIYDKPLDSDLEFDPEDLKGKELYGNVKPHVYEGKPQKRVEEFAPASKPPF